MVKILGILNFSIIIAALEEGRLAWREKRNNKQGFECKELTAIRGSNTYVHFQLKQLEFQNGG